MIDPTIRVRFADMLTEKIVESIRGMPAIDSADVRDLELIISAQIVTGRRSMSAEDARTELTDYNAPVI